MHADCRDVLPRLANASVDHCFADPPYSEKVHARSIRRTTLPDVRAQPCRRTRKHDFGFDHLTREQCGEYAYELTRVVKRWVAVFADMEIAAWWQEDLENEATDYVRTCVWVKDRAMPQISGDRPSSRTEAIVLAHRKGPKRWNKRRDCGDSNVFQYPVVVNCNGHRDDRVHTAQKPLELMKDIVDSFTDPDETIIDPFCGSGTTLLAGLQLGARVIGIDRDAGCAMLAGERLQASVAGSTLTARRAKQEVLFGSAR